MEITWFTKLLTDLERNNLNGIELRTAGEQIFKSLFQGRVGSLFTFARSKVSQNSGLRIRIVISSGILSRLPWEFLYDDKFIAIYSNTPIVRSVPDALVDRNKRIIRKLKILVIISSPNDKGTLNVDREIRYMKSELADLESLGLLELSFLKNTTIDRLQKTLKNDFDIFHFIGHGEFDESAGKGSIVLEDDSGSSKNYDGETLASLLSEANVKLAILNACDTARSAESGYLLGVAHSLLRGGVPTVIAMQFKIPDMAAILFTKQFYGELAERDTIEVAITKARQYMAGNLGIDTKDWGTPVIYETVLDDFLFSPKATRKPSSSLRERTARSLGGVAVSRATRAGGRSRSQVVGICDINSLLIDLNILTKKMNNAQKYFSFQVLPSYYSADIFSIFNNTQYCDFVKASPRLRRLFDRHRELGLKTIIGITQNLITDERWSNLFSVSDNASSRSISLISTFILEEYSLKAHRSLEEAVMSLIVGEIAAIFGNIEYHEVTNGCAMDFCRKREDIIHYLRNPIIEPSCKAKLDDVELALSLESLLETIRSKRR